MKNLPATKEGSGGVLGSKGYDGRAATVVKAGGGGGGGPYNEGEENALGQPCLSIDEISCVDDVMAIVFG